MNKTKVVGLLLAIILLAGVLTGCGTKAAVQNSGTAATQQAQTFPLKVTDFNGFEMTIPKKPERIISLTLGTDEMLLSLVDKSRIKYLSGKIADDAGISNVADQAKSFPKAENNLETIIAAKPDLVLAASWMKKEAIQQLRDAGIPVYCYGTPTNIEEQKKVVLETAHLVGEDAGGQQIVADMDKKLQDIAARLQTLKPGERLSVLSYNTFGSSSGLGTMFDDLAGKADLVNLVSKAGLKQYSQLSREEIVKLNPDIIIIPSWSYDKKRDPASFLTELETDKSLAGVNAVKNHRVYMLPDKHMTCVSQYIVLGVEALAKAAYPQLFR